MALEYLVCSQILASRSFGSLESVHRHSGATMYQAMANGDANPHKIILGRLTSRCFLISYGRLYRTHIQGSAARYTRCQLLRDLYCNQDRPSELA